MEEKLDYIFSALDDAKIGTSMAVKLFDNAVTRTSLLHWRQGKCQPRTEFTLRVIFGYSQLIRRAVDRGMLPIKGKMSHEDRYQAVRATVRAMKDVKP